MIVKRSTQSASRIVGPYEVSGNEADGRKTAFWSSVLDYVIESFALYAASIHPVTLFPVEPRPPRRGLTGLVRVEPRQVLRQRREALRIEMRHRLRLPSPAMVLPRDARAAGEAWRAP